MKRMVSELMLDRFVKGHEEDPIHEVMQSIAESRETMIACVVDGEDRLTGIITPTELLKAVEVRQFGIIRYPFFHGSEALRMLTAKYAKDIMSSPVSVKPDDTIEKTINIMLDEGLYEMPVVDKEGKVIGEVNFFDIIGGSIEYLKK